MTDSTVVTPSEMRPGTASGEIQKPTQDTATMKADGM